MKQTERIVLYVGDESGSVQEFREAVEGAAGGFRVEQVADGVEALAWLQEEREERAEAIILDLALPVLEAWGFLKGLKGLWAEPSAGAPPVVLISAHAKDPRLARLGVAALVERPVEVPLLVEALRSLFPAA